jgi:FAD/FMN-containing dehydrogenase
LELIDSVAAHNEILRHFDTGLEHGAYDPFRSRIISWNRYIDVLDPEGSRVRLQPGVIGGHANRVFGTYYLSSTIASTIQPSPASR